MLKHAWPIGLLTVMLVLDITGCITAPVSRQPMPVTPDEQRALAIIQSLTQPAMQGRGLGTQGLQLARNTLASEMKGLGLKPMMAAEGMTAYFQPFDAQLTPDVTLSGDNLIGLIPGQGDLANQYLVIGAHYDHLGLGPHAVNDPEQGREVRPGADDNASGVAAVLLLAKCLSESLPARLEARRSVLVILFSGEEHRCLGSRHWIEHRHELGIAPDAIIAMLNFDMVGRMRSDRVYVFGTAMQIDWLALMEPMASELKLKLIDRIHALGVSPQRTGPSDHAPFIQAGIPAIQFYTGIHEDYHRVSDTGEKINLSGIARLVELAHRLAMRLATDPSLSPSAK